MAAFGIKAIQPQDNEHILGFATARATADMSLLEVWNGPTNSSLVYTLDEEGQHQSANGTAARPTYSFEADKDSGRYMSGAGTFLDVIGGTAVGTWTAGKLTLVELQVDNLNLNGNTLSSTAGTDLLITPLSGQQIVLDGTIVIDAGVVTGATSITSTAFVGTLTGASTATLVTVVDSTDTTSFIAIFDSATGDLAAKTDGGLTYNAGTGMLTATGLTGPLTGLASTATLATTVTASANNSTDETVYPTFVDGATGTQGLETDTGLTYNPSDGMLTAAGFTGPLTGLASTATLATSITASANNSTNETVYPAFVDGATGTQGIETDTGLTYNPSTGMLTAEGFTGPLTGLASTASLATEATSITAVANNSTDEIVYPAFVDGATGTQGIETDTGLTYNPSSGTLTSTVFVGALTGNVTGTADVATVATTVTISDNESTDEANALIFTAGGDVDGGNIGLESDGTLTYNPSTGKVTATGFVGTLAGAVTGNADTATLASTVTVAASGGDVTSHIAMFDSVSGSLAALTDPGLTYNATSNVLTAVGGFAGDITGGVTGNADTATEATSITAVANNSTDEDIFLTFVDGATGTQGIETDTGLTYNPSTGLLTAAGFAGPLTGAVTGTASVATTVTITDNESTNENNALIFTAGGDVDGGNLGLESDGTLTYNPSTGKVTATGFIGDVTGDLTGDVTGNADTATALATARTIGGTSFDGTGNIVVALATEATTITAVANNSTNETVYPAFVDGATGTQGLETDTGLTYNPSSGILTGTRWAGDVTGDVTGKADTADTLETARTIGGTAFDGSANIAVALATLATTVTISDNESTNESNALIFTAGGDVDGGNLGLESDGTLTYNPSTGKVTATGFVGTLAGAVTGNVTGNCSGTALTVTQAAQTAITSVGTLTALQVDNLNINGNTLSSTAGTDLLITPKTGEQIVLDGTIVIDAGVVTGATSITSTAFAGALTGNVTGNASGTAATVTGAAQTAITSVGTLTSLAVGNITSTGNLALTAGLAAIGSTTNAAIALNITSNDMAGTSQYGINANPTFTADATAAGYGMRVLAGTINESFTQTNTYGILIESGYEGSGSTITNLYGLKIENQASGGTNYAIHTGTGTVALGADLTVVGSVSKGSGSFKIAHPLPAKADTHHLVHSFIEGPQADLIYRGVADLSGGSATVDLDEAAGMSAGTWELLCRDPQVWVQNDSGWSGVRGSVEGSTLTIECESSSDTVSWMVVAERCDPHMMETGWTDDGGHVIVEPERGPVIVEPERESP